MKIELVKRANEEAERKDEQALEAIKKAQWQGPQEVREVFGRAK